MKALDIVNQLKAQMPNYTTLFSSAITVASITYSAGLGTVTTSAAHGLVTGDVVNIKDAISPNPITSLTRIGQIAFAITANDHDLVFSLGETVVVTGAVDPLYNGTRTLLSVLTRRQFTYVIDDSAAASTTGGILNETINYGYNGFFQIIVLSPTTFTYPVLKPMGSPAIGSPKAYAHSRITGAVGPDKMMDSYTKQPPLNYYAYVVIEDTVASKSRSARNDAEAVRGAGDDPRQKLIQNFSVYIFAPCKDEIAGRKVKDDMEDVFIALCASLLGYRPPSYLSEETTNAITFVAHGTYDYKESFYVHKFNFQNLVDITFDDTLQERADLAFRDIHIDYIDPLTSDGDDVIMTSDINLDEVIS